MLVRREGSEASLGSTSSSPRRRQSQSPAPDPGSPVSNFVEHLSVLGKEEEEEEEELLNSSGL